MGRGHMGQKGKDMLMVAIAGCGARGQDEYAMDLLKFPDRVRLVVAEQSWLLGGPSVLPASRWQCEEERA